MTREPVYYDNEHRWKIRVVYTDNGIRREKVFSSSKKGTAGKRECIAKYRAWCGNTFDYVWSKYISDRTFRLGADSRCVKNDVSVGNNFFLPNFTDKSLDSLNIRQYQDFINHITLKNGEQPSAKYLRNIMSTLNAFLTWAWEQEYLLEPMRGKLYLPTGHSIKGKNIPTWQEFERLCEPTNLWYQPLIIFLFTTGMRPSEALFLKRDDIVGEVAYVRGGLLRSKKISTGKTKNAVRTVPLCALANKQIEIMLNRVPNSKYVFCNKEGEAVCQDVVYKQLQTLCKRKGIKPLSLYSGRHFFVTYTTQALGISAEKHTVGHSPSMLTVETYTQTTAEEVTHIKGTLDSIFGEN